ncbi:Mobilization protein A [compost metagenome]
MAIGRLSMKVGKAGKAGPHAAYIAREGQYANRLDKGERLEATEVGNMPTWAEGQPQMFWLAADAFERANGTTYREMEIALPRELDSAQRIELAREWVKQEIGERHAYQWAIHVPTAADGKDQPHLHLMFSERQVDGIERDPEQYFKRYNAKAPEKGGARKGYGEHAGQTLSHAERIDDLKALRTRWEDACNGALERAERAERIDMRSHAERGTGLEPERKQLPSEWRDQQQRAQVIEFRAARGELATANRELARAVPDVRGELVSLERERERRRPVEKDKSAAEIRQEIEQYKRRHGRRPFMDASQVAAQLLTVTRAYDQVRHLTAERDQVQANKSRVLLEIQEWSERHPVRAKMAAMGLNKPVYLVERENAVKAAEKALEALPSKIEQADKAYQQIRREETAKVEEQYRPQREWMAQAERLAAERDRAERQAASREVEQRRERDPERERSRGRDFPRGR